MSLKYEVVRYNNSTKHYRYGVRHRTDGPATIRCTGTMIWEQYGSNHRTDGPAYILQSGPCIYFIRGLLYNPDDYDTEIRDNS